MTAIVAYDSKSWGDKKVPKFRTTARAMQWMKRNGYARLPDSHERVFLKNPTAAVEYAVKIRSRLPVEYEQIIMNYSDPNLGFKYLRDVVGGPLAGYEDIFKDHPKLLVRYSKQILKSRLPEHLEMCLVGDPYACFEYAWGVLDGRLPENLHNYMFAANMDPNFENTLGRYRSGSDLEKLNDMCDYSPDRSSPKEYFEFIKKQRKYLHRLVNHYAQMYDVDTNRSISDLLHELEHGR